MESFEIIFQDRSWLSESKMNRYSQKLDCDKKCFTPPNEFIMNILFKKIIFFAIY